MKLKKVEVTYQYVIVVEDNADRKAVLDVARRYVHEAVRDIELNIRVSPYKPDIFDNWDDECIPYGGDGNTPTREYLK